MHVPLDYERLYRDAIPSVVSVYVGRTAPGVGAGSGFVYDAAGTVPADADPPSDGDGDGGDTSDAGGADGVVVTNEHVVRGVGEVELRFSDGQWRTGEVAGRDAYTDLAVVRVPNPPADATPLPVATTSPAPGRPVAALGNPMGLDGSISAGIVSGVNRSLPTSNRFAIPDVVQTDAPINPGNSGGPLVALADSTEEEIPDDYAYEVVGVNRARQGDNIGFAVSPAIVNRVVPALISEGRYRHSYLRTRTVDVTPAVAEANGLDVPRGVLVVDVAEGPTGGDALRGCDRTAVVRGQQVPVGGDVVVGIGGRELCTHEGLMRYLITETRPGEPVEIDAVRDGRPVTLRVELGERPDTDADDGGRAVRVG